MRIFLHKNRGQSMLLLVGTIAVIIVMMIGVYSALTDTNINSSGSHKARQIAIEAADAGINQLISDITNRQINIIGATLPMTLSYPVQISGTSLTVPVTINKLLDSSSNPVLDLEGNQRYIVDAIATPIIAYGAGRKVPITRHVRSHVTIVNMAKYNAFTIANDIWAGGNSFDGPYHCNGTTLSIGGTMYWNSSALSSGATNPFYSDTYVTMSAGTIVQAGGYATPDFKTMSSKHGRHSASTSYDICTSSSRPSGTWFDKAHGGAVVNIRPIPYQTYNNYAQVILQLSNLPYYRLNGADTSSTTLTIDVGVSGYTPRLKINLNAFGTGSSDDLFDGMANYVAALQSTYGIIIYCIDDAAVYGQLPVVAGTANTNKKVMIVSQKSIELIGDVLYSGDTYNTLPSYNPAVPTPIPSTSNPTNDAIALICSGSIYVNPWRLSSTAFFHQSDDMKIDGYLYGYSGALEGAGRTYNSGGSSSITQFTTFGGQTFNHGSTVPGTFNVGYDPTLANNISRLVPVGVGVISWMEMQ